MKKILLIQPPIRDFYDTPIRLQPIGLCSLKAAIKQHLPAVKTTVLDFHQGHGRKTIALPPELAYLKDYYFLPDSGPFRSFDQFFHFGADYEDIARLVRDLAPDLVGISALFTPYFREVLACARAIRKKCSMPIVVGGSHVSACPESILRNPHVDYVISGEGERPLVELILALGNNGDLSKVANLGFKKNGCLIFNPREKNYPLHELPIPDFSDLDPKSYLYDGKPVCMLMASRGCPHRCSFCSVSQTFGRFFRMREIEDIIAEIEQRYLEGYRVFDFEDDNLTFALPRFKELCQRLISTLRDRDIQLLAMNGVSYRNLDNEALTLMRQAGFTHLNLALVSANQKILAATGRPHQVSGFSKIAEAAFSSGFKTVGYQILGLPGESLDSMVRTLVFLARQPILIGVSTFYLIPGSALAAAFPTLDESDMVRARSTAMALESRDCSRDDLFTLFISARIINFLKGVRLLNDEKTLDDLLRREHEDDRSSRGFQLLRILFAEDRLSGISRSNDLLPIARFQAALFYRILKESEWIRTLEGKTLLLPAARHSLPARA